jgi:hypothetical protein
VAYELEYRVGKIARPTADKFEGKIFYASQGIGVRVLAVQEFDERAFRRWCLWLDVYT